jgi:hypothetical protein
MKERAISVTCGLQNIFNLVACPKGLLCPHGWLQLEPIERVLADHLALNRKVNKLLD